MDVFTHFVKKWSKLYDGIMDPLWLDQVLPASVFVNGGDGKLVYVHYVRLEDDDFFRKFEEVYGVDILHIWTQFYHWKDEGSYGQPSKGELRDFAQKYECYVREAICQANDRDAQVEISRMNHTPVTTEIDDCLEMVGLETKVRILHVFTIISVFNY